MSTHDTTTRSRSPHNPSPSTRCRRSRSPRPDRDHHRRHRHHHHGRHRTATSPKPNRATSPALPPRPVILPFSAKPLSKHDHHALRNVFASYLDIQKQLDLADLSDAEAKGRWKSFMGRWNRGELAAGWYDPSTRLKADEEAAAFAAEERAAARPPPPSRQDGDGDNSDSDIGPPRPPADAAGPAPPTFSDLALRDALDDEQRARAREDMREARRAERKAERERLEEIAPRAEAGTRERMLEKRREAGAAAREFREGRGGAGEMEEVDEGQVMGGSEDVRAVRAREESKRSERQLRREEFFRARAAEREERLKQVRDKEEKTMAGLRALAKERFGGGAAG